MFSWERPGGRPAPLKAARRGVGPWTARPSPPRRRHAASMGRGVRMRAIRWAGAARLRGAPGARNKRRGKMRRAADSRAKTPPP